MNLSMNLLCQACACGDLSNLESLLVPGTDIDAVGIDAFSHELAEHDIKPGPLLHIAACYNQPEIVEYLITAGASVHQTSKTYGSALVAALEGASARILREACLKDYEKPAQELPRSGKSYENTSQDEEVSTCQRIVLSLLAAGARSDPGDRMRSFGSALHLAAYLGSEIIVRSLIEQEVEEVNSFGGYFGSALHAAQHGGHVSVMRELLDQGVEVNHCAPSHGYVIHHALEHGSLDNVNQLMRNGADLNAYEEKHGSTFVALMRRVNKSRDIDDDDSSDDSDGSNSSYEDDDAVVELVLTDIPPVQVRPCDLPQAVRLPASVDPGSMVSKFLCCNDRSGSIKRQRKVLEALLERSASVDMSETALVGLIRLMNDDRIKLLRRLLKQTSSLGTTPAMLKAVREPKLMIVLLQHRPICPITQDIFEAATKTLPGGFSTYLLLERGWGVPVTPDLILAVLKQTGQSLADPDLIKSLLDRSTDQTVTDEMLAVTKNLDVVSILVERRRTQSPIGATVIERIASVDSSHNRDIVANILQSDKSVEVTDRALQHALAHADLPLARLLWTSNPNLNVSEQDLGFLKSESGLDHWVRDRT